MRLASRLEGVTNTQLAEACGITVSAARNILRQLEDLGELEAEEGAVPKVQSPGRAPVVWRKVDGPQDT
jgi:ribosomal protein S25